ncbi:hypothetical protein [Xanthomonas vesicatoria]|uniref:Uncharacterized protein n=1 Tax=Xanthomonas vesicatoria TaxID=56460 RepID=A0ABS8LEC8_9XANT|nr:hypothetical protein [Xanthomonas vesicatoria]MCC8602684.1 hypothetical protein [Xanthomonas vesicatoria]MCC8611189.1 hypothetical protein [Xanthomonas vesicatoria]MCC8624104.1 hypothetical protein [Xanthomonas vesicatoria]MCC8695903.1 hypothetical protein [Xanthomonas vesicatoria]MCC8701710.1 hypothetical protein [Xanthomonas vesicatoria]
MKSQRVEFNPLVLPTVLVAATLALSGTAQASVVTSTPTPSATAAAASESYRPGQKWIVPGEWEFTVDSARVAKVKIPNHGGGSWVPTQVILLSYSYKNIGFDDSANFKDGGPSTLAFSKAQIDVVDANDADNGGAGNYPVRIKRVEDADGQKPGQKMVGAQWPYAFKKKVGAVRVTVSHYDSTLKLHEATFLVPVEGARHSRPHANKHVHHG